MHLTKCFLSHGQLSTHQINGERVPDCANFRLFTSQEVDIPDTDETNKAAANIQAVFRGKQTRKEF